MNARKSSIDQVVMKLVDYYDLSESSTLNVGWPTFIAVYSSGEPPVYDSLRTIREKWRVLQALGYLQPINQYACKVNVRKIFSEVVSKEGARCSTMRYARRSYLT